MSSSYDLSDCSKTSFKRYRFDPYTSNSMHDHQGYPVPPQAEEADLRASLDECAKQAPGDEALLMIGHLPPCQPRGQSAAGMQEVPLVF